MIAREPLARAAEAGLNLVGDEHHTVVGAPLRHGRQEAAAGTMKPPSPWIGSMITAARFVAPTSASIRAIARSAACGPSSSSRNGVGRRHPVDLRGERAERVLVRHVLRGQRHGQVGAPVIGVLYGHDRVPAGVGAGDLDRVLHRFGAGVEQG